MSMVITYYIKLFRTGADRHNGILMSLLLLATETKRISMLTGLKVLSLANVYSTDQNIMQQKDPMKLNFDRLVEMQIWNMPMDIADRVD